MSYLDHVKRQTKNVCPVYLTPSNTLRAVLQVKGQKRTQIEKDTEEGAANLIRWINQNYAILSSPGLLPDLEQLKRNTVLHIVDWYRSHSTPKKNHKAKLTKADLSHLNRLSKDDIAKLPLSNEAVLINAAHIYISKRLDVTEVTSVNREIALYRAMFKKANKERALGLANIPMLFQGMQYAYDPDDYACTRSELTPEDEARILHALETDTHGPNKSYTPLAFMLKLHTGLRPDELFSLRHKDCDLDAHRIHIPKRTTEGKGKPRANWIIPMSPWVYIFLRRLQAELIMAKTYDPHALLFPPSDRPNRYRKYGKGKPETRQLAIQTAFNLRVNALGLNDDRDERDRLHFRALRRIARCRFEYDMGLKADEAGFMLGRKVNLSKVDPSSGFNDKIDRTHYDDKKRRCEVMCTKIQAKMDRYYLHGKTWAEYENEVAQMSEEEKFQIYERIWKAHPEALDATFILKPDLADRLTAKAKPTLSLDVQLGLNRDMRRDAYGKLRQAEAGVLAVKTHQDEPFNADTASALQLPASAARKMTEDQGKAQAQAAQQELKEAKEQYDLVDKDAQRLQYLYLLKRKVSDVLFDELGAAAIQCFEMRQSFGRLVYLGDLIQKTEAELSETLPFRNPEIRRKGINQIKEALRSKGLKLGTPLPFWKSIRPKD